MPIVITLEKRDTRPSQSEAVYFAKTFAPNMDMVLNYLRSYLITNKVHVEVGSKSGIILYHSNF